MPSGPEPHFNRALVFVLEHGERGTMGLVLNKPSPLPMGTFCKSQEMRFRGDKAAPVYRGGPVQTDRAFLLHISNHRGPETEDICHDIKFSFSLESLEQLAGAAPVRFRAYLGYAGWKAQQLEAELLKGAWLVSPVQPELVFDTPCENMWERALRTQGISPMQLLNTGTQDRSN